MARLVLNCLYERSQFYYSNLDSILVCLNTNWKITIRVYHIYSCSICVLGRFLYKLSNTIVDANSVPEYRSTLYTVITRHNYTIQPSSAGGPGFNPQSKTASYQRRYTNGTSSSLF